MRFSSKVRKTLETEIKVEINLDGQGNKQINTGIKFFDHMLEQFAMHGGYDLKIEVTSMDKDNHHVVEDVALTLGAAFLEAIGDKKGINRYGERFIPMDEALALSVVDLSGRVFAKVDAEIKDEKTSDFETVLLSHFFSSFAQASLSTIHIKLIYGTDTHHIIEAIFKSFARAISMATSFNEANRNVIPSTKGLL